MDGQHPRSMRSHMFQLDEGAFFGAVSVDRVIEVLAWKQRMERERLLRLLPPAPPGTSWGFETQVSEDIAQNVISYRVVARLQGMEPWKLAP